MTAASSYTDFALFRRLVRQARPYWLHTGGIFLLNLLSIPFALLTPLPLKIAVDSVIGSEPLPGLLDTLLPAGTSRSDSVILVLAAGLVVVIALLSRLQGLGSWLLQTYTGEKLVLSFRAQIFRRVQRLSLAYHDSKGTTDSTYRIQYDAPSIQYIMINGVFPFITAGFTLISIICVVGMIAWQLAAVVLAVLPVLFMLIHISGRRLRSQWFEVKELESSAMSVVQEVLTAVRVVKAFGQEDREQERFVDHSSKSMWGHLRIAYIEGSSDLLVSLTIAAGMAAALFIGVRLVQPGTLTLGELLLVMGYLSQISAPMYTISKTATTLQSSLASAERAFALLDESPDVAERPNAQPLARAAGGVAFRDVSFDYERGRTVLRDISFEISPGTRVGIAGTTGAGKTTLLNLLTRFYDPTSGQILLDGVDLRDYKLRDLRDQYAIVLQEPLLFSTSIAENIAYARPTASEEEIIEAAKAADAHEFIVSLPEGYETRVGERGMRLSGGERQRISLARAFLKDAPILILDEPTSSVDVRTEAAIMGAMERLMEGRTSFMITHRPSTMAHCNTLLVIQNGQLVVATSEVSTGIRKAMVYDRSASHHLDDLELPAPKVM